jgi:hypothetical protein
MALIILFGAFSLFELFFIFLINWSFFKNFVGQLNEILNSKRMQEKSIFWGNQRKFPNT